MKQKGKPAAAQSLAEYGRRTTLAVSLLPLAVIGLTFTSVILFGGYTNSATLRDQTLLLKKEMLRAEVLRTVSFLEFIIASNPDGAAETLQQIALSRYRSYRFGGSGYIFIASGSGVLLFSGRRNEYAGRDSWSVESPLIREAADKTVITAMQSGGGFFSYVDTETRGALGSNSRDERLAYVIGFPQWDWIVGASVSLMEIEELMTSQVKRIWIRFILSALFVLCALASVFHLTMALSHKKLREISGSLDLLVRHITGPIRPGQPIDPDAFPFREFRVIAENLNERNDRRTAAEKALRESERKYREIVSNANSAIVKFDISGRITFFNECAERMFGFTSAEVLGKLGIETINTPDQEEFIRGLLSPSHEYGTYENANIRKDRTSLWVSWTDRGIYDDEGNKTGILCIATDVTAQKAARELVDRSLREKEVLLREIHHRVKNNLQIITSLINLNSVGISDPHDRAVLLDLENRIISMAIIHEVLYESEDISAIDMPIYLNRLVASLRDSYAAWERGIGIEGSFDPFSATIDTALPCGLIVNELVSNSLKYAFPEEAPGETETNERRIPRIGVSLECRDRSLILRVSDNGIGLPDPERYARGGTMGLRLVRLLTDQISGSITLDTASGTSWEIVFPPS